MSALLQRLLAQRSELSTNLTNLLATVEERAAAGGDDHLTEAEEKNRVEAEALAKDLDERIASLTAMEQREAAAAAVAVTVAPAPQVEQRATTVGGARVTSEPLTYHERGDHSWVRDQIIAQGLIAGVPGTSRIDATDRLERHAQEMTVELRDTTTTSYAGLVPPQYLVDEFTPVLRAGRPFANIVNGMPLPPTGMTAFIPRATSGATVSTQATQNTAPTTTDMAFSDLSVPIISFSGRGVLSRQAIERAAIDLDRVTFQDLAADAARYLDQQCLYGTGAGGNALGAINTGSIITVAITGTTGLDLIKAIANAAQSINTQRFIGADAIIMHPRRWGALTIAVDTANRPLVSVEAGQMNAFGQGQADLTQTTVGTVLGIPVITDPNLRTNLGAGTNQDEVLVVRRSDLYLWEQPGTVREFRFEQPVGPQSIQLAVYGNAAFTAGRYPVSVAYISGAGLVPPTF